MKDLEMKYSKQKVYGKTKDRSGEFEVLIHNSIASIWSNSTFNQGLIGICDRIDTTRSLYKCCHEAKCILEYFMDENVEILNWIPYK